MAWETATLSLQGSSCPAVAALPPGVRLECSSPRTDGSPFGHVGAACPPGWEQVSETSIGCFVRLPGADCASCPLARLPPEMRHLSVQASHRGVRFHVAYPAPGLLRDLLDRLAREGQSPRMVRRRPGDAAAAPILLMQPDRLTRLQWDTLRTAAEIGHFDRPRRASLADVARRTGRSRSTVHEHLRKALGHVLETLFPPRRGAQGRDGAGGLRDARGPRSSRAEPRDEARRVEVE